MNETQIQYETKDSREIFHIRGKGSIWQLKSNMSYFDPALLVPDFSAWQSSASCNYTIAGPQICHPWVRKHSTTAIDWWFGRQQFGIP